MTDTLTRTFAGLPTAEPDEIGLSRSGLKRLTAVMEREIAAGLAPGLSMLIARNGKIGFTKALGALAPDGPAMSLDAIFRIYSMTKPIVSVAAMMLVEEGRMLITDPLSKYIPAFADSKVGVETGDRLDLVPLKRPITIQDLMRHTSGLTYGFGTSKVDKLVAAARVTSQEKTMAEHAETLAALPLLHQPGEVWEYSLSTDVLGRVVEVVEGGKLGDILRERIFGPLGMDDTAFFIPSCEALARGEADIARHLSKKPRRRPGARHRAAAMRVGRRRLVVDARRLCALPRDAQRRRRARRRAHPRRRGRSGTWRATTWDRM